MLPSHLSGLLRPSLMGHGYMSPGSKADFVAGCVGVRAAARTYLNACSAGERDGLLTSWKEVAAGFLLEGEQAAYNEDRKFHDGDFHIKYHAAHHANPLPWPSLPLFN
ncbi:hypothetical protein PG999_000251 [Apiospora kogelbergensis]|uniref:Fatty acid desaturase n=1 Tax=Apiospora kogelbergensis TaxID=1337665 RepID=A0AAW0RB74_9PEZI